MTPEQRIARAHRAQSFLDEFLTPMFDRIEAEYTARVIEVANTELHPGQRSDKITTLAYALKIVRTLKSGMAEEVRDGELARNAKLKSEHIEKMTDAQQRLLRIAG